MTSTNLLKFVLTLCICSSVFGQDLPEWVERAEAGDANAQFVLGVRYDNGIGVPEDDTEAVKWYRLAADQGDADAQLNLGLMYDNGNGVPEDDTEAVKWYRLAADRGHAIAQFNLGVMYATGNGVPEDDVESYARLNVAGALGYESAKTPKETLIARMTKEDISAAQKRSKEIWEALESRKAD